MRERIEPRLAMPPRSEHRNAGIEASWGAAGTLGGSKTSMASENLSAVLGAVELISGAVASLPASIVQDTPDGRKPLPGAAAGRVLSRPNTFQSWPSYIGTVVSSLLMQGNSLSMVQHDARGGVTGLIPVPWLWISPQVVTGGNEARLVFDLMTQNVETSLLGLPNRMLAEDVLHIKTRSDNGILGKSVLSRAPSVLDSAFAVQSLVQAEHENGAKLSGMVSPGVGITADGIKRMQASFNQKYTGTHNAGRILFADPGSTFTALQMTSADAELLASRRFGVEEVARIFSIPAPMLQTGATAPATLTPFLTAFAQLALAPIVNLIEAEWDDLLPAGQHLQIDLGGLMRGDYSAVAAAQAVLVQSKISTPNDARRVVGLPVHPDGDELGTSAPANYPADATGMPSLAPKPGPGGTLPNVDTHQNEGSAAA